jgi:hypothetical protein
MGRAAGGTGRPGATGPAGAELAGCGGVGTGGAGFISTGRTGAGGAGGRTPTGGWMGLPPPSGGRTGIERGFCRSSSFSFGLASASADAALSCTSVAALASAGGAAVIAAGGSGSVPGAAAETGLRSPRSRTPTSLEPAPGWAPLPAAAAPDKWRRTRSATSSSIELEWVTFSARPSSCTNSMTLCDFTSSCRASSLMRILLIVKRIYLPALLLVTALYSHPEFSLADRLQRFGSCLSSLSSESCAESL